MERLTAQPFLTASLLRQTAQMRAQLQDHLHSMTSGQVGDLGQHLQGNFTRLSAIDASLSRNSAYLTAMQSLALRSEMQQAGLTALATEGQNLSQTILASISVANVQQVDLLAAKGHQSFAAAVAMLNSQAAGQSVFGGVARGAAIISGAQDILQALQGVLGTATDASLAHDMIKDWFEGPIGYASLYSGGAAVAPLQVALDEAISLPVDALAPAVRQHLAALAIPALLDQGLFAGDAAARASLLRRAGDDLILAGDGISDLRGQVGLVEARVSERRAFTQTESAALSLSRTQMVMIEPEETAVRLQDVEARLQTLYSLMARLSALKLSDYLR